MSKDRGKSGPDRHAIVLFPEEKGFSAGERGKRNSAKGFLHRKRRKSLSLIWRKGESPSTHQKEGGRCSQFLGKKKDLPGSLVKLSNRP